MPFRGCKGLAEGKVLLPNERFSRPNRRNGPYILAMCTATGNETVTKGTEMNSKLCSSRPGTRSESEVSETKVRTIIGCQYLGGYHGREDLEQTKRITGPRLK